jgi:hypothetical protein
MSAGNAAAPPADVDVEAPAAALVVLVAAEVDVVPAVVVDDELEPELHAAASTPVTTARAMALSWRRGRRPRWVRFLGPRSRRSGDMVTSSVQRCQGM